MTSLKQILDESRRLGEKATPGPWHQWEKDWIVSPIPSEGEIGTNEGTAYTVGDRQSEDAAIIVHLRNSQASLEEQVQRLVSALECYVDATCDGGFADNGRIARAALKETGFGEDGG